MGPLLIESGLRRGLDKGGARRVQGLLVSCQESEKFRRRGDVREGVKDAKLDGNRQEPRSVIP